METNRVTKKVRFNLEEETFLEEIKEELKKEKLLVVELENKILLQSEEADNLKGENQNLMEEI